MRTARAFGFQPTARTLRALGATLEIAARTSEPVAHCIAFYEYMVARMTGSWPMRRNTFLQRIAEYRKLM